MPATLSIMGLYNADPGVIDPLVSAMPTQDLRQALPAELLSECAELEVIYPNPSTFKTILAAWVKHRKPIWDKLYSTTQYEYDPIYNYDRREEETISTDRTRSSTDTYTDTNTDTQYHTPGEQKTTATDKRYGFNDATTPAPASVAESTMEPVLEKRVLPSGTSGWPELALTLKGTEVTRDSGQDGGSAESSGTEGENVTRTHRAYGNIGVTTTQQMIEQERQSVKYDLLEDVVNDFKARFCLMVY